MKKLIFIFLLLLVACATLRAMADDITPKKINDREESARKAQEELDQKYKDEYDQELQQEHDDERTDQQGEF